MRPVRQREDDDGSQAGEGARNASQDPSTVGTHVRHVPAVGASWHFSLSTCHRQLRRTQGGMTGRIFLHPQTIAPADERSLRESSERVVQPEVYASCKWSWWLPHLRSKDQQPGDGRSMMEGPGPPSTVRVTVCRVPARAALICSGESTEPTLATHRILLSLPAAGGTTKGWCETQTMAAMSPPSPRTYGTGCLGGSKPDLAHPGRRLAG